MAERPHVVAITSPLEAEHVARIRAVAPDRVAVLWEPDLLPPVRYRGDHKGADGFRLTAEQEARRRAQLARATILWDFPAGRPEAGGGLALAPRVRWVQTTSSGVGQLVAGLGLADSDLVVTTARGVHADALAEFALLGMLSHVKDLPRLVRDQRAHRWERYCCGELAGATLVVVGAGEVGNRVAMVAKALRMRVVSLVNRPAAERRAALAADLVLGPGDLDAALAEADYLVLAAPHTPATERMIDRAALARTKPGVVLINIGRGQLVDEPALVEALRSGHVAFAALDVAAVEPLPPDSPLWDMETVLISPHSASTAPSENAKITDIFCRNLALWVAGRQAEMINVLDKRRLY